LRHYTVQLFILNYRIVWAVLASLIKSMKESQGFQPLKSNKGQYRYGIF